MAGQPEYLKIVLYNPEYKKIGKAIIRDMKVAKITELFRGTISPILKIKEIQTVIKQSIASTQSEKIIL